MYNGNTEQFMIHKSQGKYVKFTDSIMDVYLKYPNDVVLI